MRNGPCTSRRYQHPRRSRIERGREEKKGKLSLNKQGDERDYPRKPVLAGPQDQFQTHGQDYSMAPLTFSRWQVHGALRACGILRDWHTWGTGSDTAEHWSLSPFLVCLTSKPCLEWTSPLSLAGGGRSYVYTWTMLLGSKCGPLIRCTSIRVSLL